MRWLLALIAVVLAVPAAAQEGEFLIIAHRGASGERPEHTLAAYERAIDQGADYIEIDLVPTQDGVLVARHENALSDTTDVAQHPEFAARLTTKLVDGEEVTDWFTEDFTLAELRTLRARERLPELRPANSAFDGLYQVPTLAEIITLVRAKEAETGRRVGLYPEIKHPSYFEDRGFDLAELLVTQLHEAGYRTAEDPVLIQSFEMNVMQRLDGMTDLRLVQLVELEGGPADRRDWLYEDMLTAQGLADLAEYVDGIGADIRLIAQMSGEPSPLVGRAHAAGLFVHGFTMRKENAFLPEQARIGANPSATGCEQFVLVAMQVASADGVFTDDPGRARRLLDHDPATVCIRPPPIRVRQVD